MVQASLKERINYEATVNLNERIGRRIRDLRRRHHITQEQLAEALDVSIKHVSAVERGLASLSLERLIDTSYILDCSLEYLILGTESNDVLSSLPLYVIELLRRGNAGEISLLQEYLRMFEKLLSNNPQQRAPDAPAD